MLTGLQLQATITNSSLQTQSWDCSRKGAVLAFLLAHGIHSTRPHTLCYIEPGMS